MNRRNFVKAVAMAPLLAEQTPFALASLPAGVPGRGVEESESQMPMRDRFELTLRRVLQGDSPAFTEEFLLADVRPTPERRFTNFSGDTSGRYIGALATATRVYGKQFPALDALVSKVIALQKPDGYFGSAFHYDKPTDEDLALLWGNGRLLVGLIEYYRLRPSAPVLSACRRIGDFLVRVGPLMLSNEIREAFGAQHFASSYICWTQQTEGLANLYECTHDARYRRLAEEIAAAIERLPGDHAHGYLTSLRGVMDLYQATADPRLLKQCELAWQDVADSTDLLITGGVPEGWSPNNHRTEGCAEADWVRLSLALWKATGQAKYLSMSERAIFNELAFNQFATGDFGHRVYTETGLPAAGAVRAWWCCTLHGLRCFPDVQTSAFRAGKHGLLFDMPIDSRVETAELSAAAESSLAENGTVRIRIAAAGNASAALAIRKPEWADKLEIRLNGSVREFPIGNGYVAIERAWVAGDTIEIKYGMQLRSEPSGKNRVAYSYGPWLLGAAASANPDYFNELTIENKLLASKNVAQPVRQRSAQPFSVPIAARAFRYTPAEYPDQPGTVVLRAIAEQAGQPTTSWELRLLSDESV
ncbi:MAG TPA: beta-L-arabinofuranosidase domain-containing protein [Terracidiphilus sp.]|nr:beta-L-arabinofuranosidase domain-containing protein [Terracidiphilus sp.]